MGIDNISFRVLKFCAVVLCYSLHYLFTLCLQQGTIPVNGPFTKSSLFINLVIDCLQLLSYFFFCAVSKVLERITESILLYLQKFPLHNMVSKKTVQLYTSY